MKHHRQLLLVMIIAISSLFAVQPASALAFADAAETQQACPEIGPQPYRIATLGLGVHGPQVTLMNVRPCYAAQSPEGQQVASGATLSCDTLGPTMARWLPVVGLGTSGSLASVNAPACMIPANLLQPADEPDARMCNPFAANVKQCVTPD